MKKMLILATLMAVLFALGLIVNCSGDDNGGGDGSDTDADNDSDTDTDSDSDSDFEGDSDASSKRNPIDVPERFHDGISREACGFELDLSGVPVPPNPGYVGEAEGGYEVSGDDAWATAFYMMLYYNCHRRAEGLEPVHMFPYDILVELQETLGPNYTNGHDNWEAREEVVGGFAEGAVQAYMPGAKQLF